MSSAANSDGSAARGSVFGRRASATRASSRSADGSGAPSHRARLSVLALAIAAFALLAFAPLSQAKTVVDGFGTNGVNTASGPVRRTVRQAASGVAVNDSGVGAARGTIYVVDGDRPASSASAPPAPWSALGQGRDRAPSTSEQVFKITATGGTFTLSFEGFTTDPIPFDVSNALTLRTFSPALALDRSAAPIGVSNLPTPATIRRQQLHRHLPGRPRRRRPAAAHRRRQRADRHGLDRPRRRRRRRPPPTPAPALRSAPSPPTARRLYLGRHRQRRPAQQPPGRRGRPGQRPRLRHRASNRRVSSSTPTATSSAPGAGT